MVLTLILSRLHDKKLNMEQQLRHIWYTIYHQRLMAVLQTAESDIIELNNRQKRIRNTMETAFRDAEVDQANIEKWTAMLDGNPSAEEVDSIMGCIDESHANMEVNHAALEAASIARAGLEANRAVAEMKRKTSSRLLQAMKEKYQTQE